MMRMMTRMTRMNHKPLRQGCPIVQYRHPTDASRKHVHVAAPLRGSFFSGILWASTILSGSTVAAAQQRLSVLSLLSLPSTELRARGGLLARPPH
jgi:hypothetical protein